jgi:hypothetical protein
LDDDDEGPPPLIPVSPSSTGDSPAAAEPLAENDAAPNVNTAAETMSPWRNVGWNAYWARSVTCSVLRCMH